ncbi:MAG: hypothetical protein ACRC0Q_09935 [Kurthia gibsonii]
MKKNICLECGFEFYGLDIVCPSCEFANVEIIEVKEDEASLKKCVNQNEV